MRRTASPLAAALAIGLTLAATSAPLSAAEKQTTDNQTKTPTVDRLQQADEKKVYQTLQAKHCIPEGDTSLRELADHLQSEIGVPVVLDEASMSNSELLPHVPFVTDDYGRLPLGSALRHILKEQELVWIVRDGSLVFTTNYMETDPAFFKTEVFNVGDLLSRSGEPGPVQYDHDSLTWMITSIIAPDSWDDVGGEGAIHGLKETIIVRQSEDVCRRIRDTLNALRRAKQLAHEYPRKAPPVASVTARSQQQQATYDALTCPLRCEFSDTPIESVAKTLGHRGRIPVLINRRALEDANIDYRNLRVTYVARDEPLGSALTRILDTSVYTPDFPEPKTNSNNPFSEPEAADAAEHVPSIQLKPIRTLCSDLASWDASKNIEVGTAGQFPPPRLSPP